MNENPDFEQKYHSKTPTGFYNFGHGNVQKTKWLSEYDQSHYENNN